MKLRKKLLWLAATLSLAFGLGGAVACNDDKNKDGSSSSVAVEEDISDFVYRVSVQNETGFAFSGVTVNLMSGDTVVASKQTNYLGNANFAEGEVEKGKYTVSLENPPAGYELPETTYQTSADKAGTVTVVPIAPTGVIQESAPNGTSYKLGDVMYDFTVKLANGTNYTLSEILKTKDMVLLNFWATWCGPCTSEFPAMHNAATAYEKDVSVLAISTTDTNAAVTSFQNSQGYSKFNMAPAGSGGLATMFGVNSIPHTVMIDRYGVIVYNHVGSMPSEGAFTAQFDKFVGNEYVPYVEGKPQGGEEDTPSDDTNNQIKPTVTPPAEGELKTAFVSSDGSANSFAFRYQEEEELAPGMENYDEYNWPWSIGEAENEKYIYPSNVNMHGSYAILYSKVTVAAGDVLTFDYKVGSEEGCDILYIMLDNAIIKQYSGNHKDKWYTSYAYVFKDYEAGEHEIAFIYMKDSETTAGDDTIHLKNLRLGKVADLANLTEDINIFRNAAADKNAEGGTTQYKNYAQVELGDDGFYHIKGSGETLYANMMNASPWNTYSLWSLAYDDYIVGDGMNFHSALEEFAWEAAQVTDVAGYTPVTEDLKHLLDAAVKYATFGQKWAGEYHENEWLELCVYWEHYGKAPLPSDPMAGITFSSAIAMKEGANKVSVPYKINPRGFKYKFVPERSGAFHVYSTGTSDSFAFLIEDDRQTMLGAWDNKVFTEVIQDELGNDISDGNFEFYWYFEKGVTYYLLFTTYLDQVATYNVNIDFLGSSYSYLENAAVGPYSANLTTFELFLPDSIEYEYADPAKEYVYANEGTTPKAGDGYYRELLEDGSLGGIIYLDVNRPTALFTSISLYDLCRQAESYKEEKRALYVTVDGKGEDLTPAFKKLCFKATRPESEYKGFVAVDKEVFELLNKLTLSTKYDGIRETWLLLCYHMRTLGTPSNEN